MAEFDAGKIKASAELDRSPFTRELAELKKQIREFTRESFEATVGLKTEKAEEDAKKFRAKTERQFKDKPIAVPVDADPTRAQLKLGRLRKQLEEMQRKVSTARVDVNDAAAQRKMDLLSAKLAKLASETANPSIDLNGYIRASTQLESLSKQVDRLDGRNIDLDVKVRGMDGAKGALARLNLLGAAVTAIAPLAVSSLGTASGAVLGFSAALAGAAGAAGVLGLGVIGTVTKMSRQIKDLTKAQDAFNKASQDVKNAKTAAQRTAALQKQAQALQDLKSAQDAANGATRPAIIGYMRLKTAWQQYVDATQTRASKLIGTALTGLASILPVLARGFNQLAPYGQQVVQLFIDFAHVATPQFLAWVKQFGGHELVVLTASLLNLATGLGNVIAAFSPFGKELADGFKTMTERWVAWTGALRNNKDFQAFVDYTRRNLPTLLSLLFNLAKDVINVGKALAPAGELALHLANGIATLIAKAPPVALLAIATAVGAIATALGGGPVAIAILVTSFIGLVAYLTKHVKPVLNTLIPDGFKKVLSLAKRFKTGMTEAFKLPRGSLDSISGFFTGLTANTKATKDELGRTKIVPFVPTTPSEMLGVKTRNLFSKGLPEAINKILKRADWSKVGTTIGDSIGKSIGFGADASTSLQGKVIDFISRIDWVSVFMSVGEFNGAGTIAFWKAIGISWYENSKRAGEDIAKAILQGVTGALSPQSVIDAIRQIIQPMINIAKFILGIHSPSTVFFNIGQDVVRGLINGLLSMLPQSNGVASQLGQGIRSKFKGAGSWLVQAGRDIVNGLTSGMRQRFGEANSATTKGVNGILSRWAKLRTTRTTAAYVVNSVMAPMVRRFNDLSKSFGGKVVGVPAYKKGGLFQLDPGGGGKPSQLAAGGAVPASQVGWTNRPTAVVGEGSRTYPEVVIPTDPKYRARAVGLWTQAGRKLSGDTSRMYDPQRPTRYMASGGVLNANVYNDPAGYLRKQLNVVLSATHPALATNTFNRSMGRSADILADQMVKYAKKAFFSGSFGAGLNFAKAQSGKPYIWGGVGPRGYDCSGFMSAIQNVIEGKSPYHRRFATATFGGGPKQAAGWIRNMRSPFMIGVDPSDHTAGTLLGVNVESSGSVGPHYGKSARGYNNSLFPYHYGLAAKSHDSPRSPRGSEKEGATFDLGGRARGIGVMPKDILAPERVLPPRETVVYEELLAALQSIKRGGSDTSAAPLINGDVLLQGTKAEQFAGVDDLMHQLRVLRYQPQRRV